MFDVGEWDALIHPVRVTVCADAELAGFSAHIRLGVGVSSGAVYTISGDPFAPATSFIDDFSQL